MFGEHRVTGILLAGGSGSRFGGAINKVFQPLGGKPVLMHGLCAMLESAVIDDIVIVCRESEEGAVLEMTEKERLIYAEKCGGYDKEKPIEETASSDRVKKISIVYGGGTRQESVYHALQADCGEIVVIQDGARPFMTEDFIRRGVAAITEAGVRQASQALEKADDCHSNEALVARTAGVRHDEALVARTEDFRHDEALAVASGSAVAVRAKDTIKLIDDDGFVTETVPRERAWQVQTPQCFITKALREAHEKFRDTPGITDDCMLIELAGGRIRLVEGDYRNIKITTPEDMLLAERFLKTDCITDCISTVLNSDRNV